MKWVTMWGNAQSIVMPRAAQYAKNLTIRYPIYVPFNGNRIRLTLDNYVIKEEITIESISVSPSDELSDKISKDLYYLTFNGEKKITVQPHQNLTSDPIDIELKEGQYLVVTIYLKDYCNITGGVYIQGPLFKGYYAYGDQRENGTLDLNTSMPMNWCFFLSGIDIYTEENNSAIICYGDSITAQDWPDYMQLKLKKEGVHNLAVIRKAVSGTRILREYDCIKYQSYGLKGDHRYLHEIESVYGASALIIQQGINDIIHPVGTEKNIFRPMSDLPTNEELIDGLKKYIKEAEEHHLKIYVGTLLPIYGWRTYAPFREEMKNVFNDYIRKECDCIDFEKAVGDFYPDYAKFKDGFDSGDHLHPSSQAYQAMGELAADHFIKK